MAKMVLLKLKRFSRSKMFQLLKKPKKKVQKDHHIYSNSFLPHLMHQGITLLTFLFPLLLLMNLMKLLLMALILLSLVPIKPHKLSFFLLINHKNVLQIHLLFVILILQVFLIWNSLHIIHNYF